VTRATTPRNADASSRTRAGSRIGQSCRWTKTARTDGGATSSLLRRARTWDVSLAYHGDEAEILLAASDGLFGARGQDPPTGVELPGLGALDQDRERMAVAHVPSDPAQAFVFAAFQGEALLWQRATEDGSYEAIELPSFRVGDYVDNVLDVAQAAYDWYVALPPAGDDTVYLGAIELVRGVRAGGQWDWTDSWKHVALAQPTSGRPQVASGLAIPTPDTVLVGTIRGDVLRLQWQRGAWTAPAALTKPRDGWISDLLVDLADPQRHWATFSNPGAVFRSDDAGASWSDVTANLPSIPLNAVVRDPANPGRVWVACDVGVFESVDAGGTWSVFGTGLPNALAVDLLFYEADRLLRVATRSRGVWEAKVG
jgi:hypothetical protein